ncbi:hypothetical protein IAR50_006346 [Cryptococcus sp. DSM 104548]
MAEFAVSPTIGQEFAKDLQLSEIVHAENKDELLRDLAILENSESCQESLKTQPCISTLSPQKTLRKVTRSSSSPPRGVASGHRLRIHLFLASKGWHFGITFEPCPATVRYSRSTHPPITAATLFGHPLTKLTLACPSVRSTSIAEAAGITLRTDVSPLNNYPESRAVHPVIRVSYTPGLVGDVAIWDNRSTVHAITQDYENAERVGDRVVSLGGKPYF